MPLSETYAYPEGAFFLYTAPAGTTGTPIAYVQEVSLSTHYEWDRKLSPVSGLMRTRVTYTLKDTVPTLQCRAFFTGLQLFQMAQSATAMLADLQFSAGVAANSAAFRCISGRFDRFDLKGEEGGIWEASIQMQFAEISAFWT